MELTYFLKEEDLLAYYIYHSEHSGVHLRQNKNARIIVLVVYTLCAALLFVAYSSISGGIMLGAGLLFYFLMPKWLKFRNQRLYKKYIKETGNDLMKEPITLRLGPDGIHSKSYVGEASYPYDRLGKIIQEKNHTYIFIGNGMAIVIPHNQVEQNQLDLLLKEIKSRISS